MAVYELETEDLAGSLAEMMRRFGTPEMPGTDASDPSKTMNWVFGPTTRHGE